MPQLTFKIKKNENMRMGIENKPKHSGQIRILDEYQICLNSLVQLLCLVTK